MAHSTITAQQHLEGLFKTTVAQRLPNIETFSEDNVRSVYEEFTKKLCNTRIQEFISATKQQLATKKGAASTIEVNLRSTLLTHHTKLGTKLGTV